MLCWRLPRHKSFCSKENSSRLLPTAGVNIAKGTRSRNQFIDFFPLNDIDKLQMVHHRKQLKLRGKSPQGKVAIHVKEFYFENLYNQNILQNFQRTDLNYLC